MTLDCQGDVELMDRMKTEQRERKQKEGTHRAYVRDDGDSLSSSDEEELDQRVAEAEGGPTKEKKGLKAWMQGDRNREKREAEDDMAGRAAQAG